MINYTLHKLPEGFIITSDQEIKKGDLKYDIVTKKIEICDYDGKFRDWKKVIAQQDQIDFSFLSEEEQKEIGWFNVDKLAYEFCDKTIPKDVTRSLHYPFKVGFQKAQELLSDRKFTLDDITQILVDYTNQLQNMKFKGTAADTINQFIAQSLSQSKSWNIEGVWENDKFKITKIL